MTVKEYNGQLFAQLLIVRVVEHAGGDNQPVHLAGHHVIDHHRLLAGIFIATGDQQLNTRLATEGLQLMRKNGKPVVGDFRHHQTNGVAAVVPQRTGVNAGLIMMFFGNRQHTLACLLRHPKLFAAAVQNQAGGGF